MDDINRIRERIDNPDPDAEGIDPEEYADDRENLLKVSRVMRRHRTGSRGWSDERHSTVLQRLVVLSWGGTKYDADKMHGTSLTAALEDKEAAGKLVDWIHDTYDNEETNRDMRTALRVFGKILTNDDPTSKDATPPPTIDWISATTSDTYDPAPNPAHMITWDEVRTMCNHPETNARDGALVAVAWDAGARSGELQDLTLGDVNDHHFGKSIRIRDGKTGTRDVTITNAVPFLKQWLSAHPATDQSGAPTDPDAPLWSKLNASDGISYRMYRNIFQNAAERIGLQKPNDPTNFRKSSASALASKGVPQAHLEDRYGWSRGSDSAARYIRVFGDDADRAIAQARGMDVEFEDPDPTGPTPCIRCDELIDRDADHCFNCGAVQDRENAQQVVSMASGDGFAAVQGVVREEVEGLLSNYRKYEVKTHG
jgi:integrase